jgi:DNA-cytosine methyltransferase
MLTVLDLCSGIGGFALGFERAGFRTAAFCEFNQFCREVLQSHWPEVPQFHDIRKLKGWHVGYVDVITAGFPCQPHSLAGKQEGPADPRDLWPDVCRLVREIMPEWFIGENVPGLDGKHMALDRVLVDLETAGYSAIPIEIPACAVDAPHIRKRIFIVANRNGELHDRAGHVGAQGRSKPANGGSRVANRNGARPLPRAHSGVCCGEESAGSRDGKLERCGGAGSHVANRASQRPQERQKPLAAQSQFPPAHRGGDMGNGAFVRWPKGRPEHEGQQGRSAFAVASISCGHMGDGALQRCAGVGLSDRRPERQAHLDAQWAGAEWITCPDGKSRRVKPGVRLLAHGVPFEMGLIETVTARLVAGEETDAKARFTIWQIMLALWWDTELASTSPDIYRDRLCNIVRGVSQELTSSGWLLGEWLQTDETLCNLLDVISSKPFEETQDLQQKVLERIRKKKCPKEMGTRVDQIMAYGNAVVPQIAEEIGRAINASRL